MFIAAIYLIYITFSVSFTYWVGRNLHTNGRIFLLDSFKQDERMADSVNQLLLVGFYLVNFGIVSLFLAIGSRPTNLVEGIEYLSYKVGIVLVILGGMHYFNMRNIANMRSKAKRRELDEELAGATI
ncbi:MAG TPA: hypothetical protein VFV50_11905 [Bdellovibrionales bacterium]|nr:hypothetical protein [Bdellovibrionales bacterium]